MMSVKEAAELWGVSIRRVQDLCSQGKVEGATRFGGRWMIPKDTLKPLDLRFKKNKATVQLISMPKQSPLLGMTNLYKQIKTADVFENNEAAKRLFDAELALHQGDITQSLMLLEEDEDDCDKDIYYRLGKGFLLSQCAIWKGDIDLWYKSYYYRQEIRGETQQEKNMIELVRAIIYCSVMLMPDFAPWFEKGNFEGITEDSFPLAKVYYCKFIYLVAIGVATKQVKFHDAKGMNLMNMIAYAIEPMISQAVIDETAIPEIYLRLNCALSYRHSNNNKDAIYHLDKALELALKDKLYGILAEFLYRFDNLLTERLCLMDENAMKEVNKLYNEYFNGWSEISVALGSRGLSANLSNREREVTRLVSYGFTNKQIATMVGISEETVKSTVKKIMKKTGLTDRADFFSIV